MSLCMERMLFQCSPLVSNNKVQENLSSRFSCLLSHIIHSSLHLSNLLPLPSPPFSPFLSLSLSLFFLPTSISSFPSFLFFPCVTRRNTQYSGQLKPHSFLSLYLQWCHRLCLEHQLLIDPSISSCGSLQFGLNSFPLLMLQQSQQNSVQAQNIYTKVCLFVCELP